MAPVTTSPWSSTTHVMVDFLSDHFVADLAFVEDGKSRPDYRIPQAVNDAYLRYKRGFASITFGATDTVRLLSIRSSDRLHWMAISAVSGLSIGIDLGIWSQGALHDGPVIDADLFMSAVTITSAARVEALTEAGNVTDEQRGTPLWEMLGLSTDSKISYDIVASRTSSDGVGAMLLEAMLTREGS